MNKMIVDSSLLELARRYSRAPPPLCSNSNARMATGSSSWKLMQRSLPNIFCRSFIILAETPNLELQRKIGVYLRRIQGEHDGWPLFHNGAFDISATVKAYFALKMIGDCADAPHMKRAREAILVRGGADRANVFTRINCSRSMARHRGRTCRLSPSNSSCCRAGFRSICRRCLIGRAP